MSNIEELFSLQSPLWGNLGHLSEQEKQARIDLAMAYRLASQKGWGDGIYTHISAAVPGEKNAYLLNQFGLCFDEITPQNLVKVNLQGDILLGEGPVNTTGFAIHGAVHDARPDANCVLHLHVDAVIAVSAQTHGLLPISQHALRFYKDIDTHQYQGVALRSAEQSSLIKSLGNKKALLLQNHGSLICGVTIQQAFYLMDVLEKACKIQVLAGPPANLILPSPAICELTYQQLCSDGDLEGQLEWSAYQRTLKEQ